MAKLSLKWQEDGPRYFLDGKPVHAGDLLDARTNDGAWTAVRFEYHWDRMANMTEPYLILPDHDRENRYVPAETECRWRGE